MYRRHTSLMEYVVMFIFGAMVLQLAVAFIAPLIPYIMAVAFLIVAGWIGSILFNRYRSW